MEIAHGLPNASASSENKESHADNTVLFCLLPNEWLPSEKKVMQGRGPMKVEHI